MISLLVQAEPPVSHQDKTVASSFRYRWELATTPFLPHGQQASYQPATFHLACHPSHHQQHNTPSLSSRPLPLLPPTSTPSTPSLHQSSISPPTIFCCPTSSSHCRSVRDSCSVPGVRVSVACSLTLQAHIFFLDSPTARQPARPPSTGPLPLPRILSTRSQEGPARFVTLDPQHQRGTYRCIVASPAPTTSPLHQATSQGATLVAAHSAQGCIASLYRRNLF